MLQTIDLNTLYHILKQYNEDVLNDCCFIICKLLDSLNETTMLQDLKTFTSIKVLLNLCEKLCNDKCETKISFPSDMLIKNVKKVLQYSDDGCSLDNEIQLEVLAILHGLFKIPCVRNSSEAVKELVKLYDYCLSHMYAAAAEKECRQDCLIFKLKVVQTVYNLLKDSTCKINMVWFYEASRLNSLSEYQVFAKLLLHGNDDVAIQTLLFLIPGYIDCFKTDQVLEAIWEEISSSLTTSSANYSRAVLILCSFLETYFGKNAVRKEFFLSDLLKDANYWQLLHSVLVKNDPVLRKQGMYLFKKTVEALNMTSETIDCFKGDIIFYWDFNLKNKLHQTYSEIIKILEYFDEQQIHIVKPAFEMAETLLDEILLWDEVSPHWILLVCHRALIHDSTEVARWGLTALLTFSPRLYSRESQHFQERIARKTVELLVPMLNNLTFYYGDGLSVTKKLKNFFVKMQPLHITKVFFSLFIKEVCSLVWSPEALFYVTHAICSAPHLLPFLGEDEIVQMRSFILRAFKTYNKIIAVGIQCELLSAIAKCTDVENVSLKNVLLLVSSFPLMESPTRKCKCWEDIVKWLQSGYSYNEAKKVLDSYKEQELGKEFNEQSISAMLILLYKVFNYPVIHIKKPNLVNNQLSEMLLSFKDIERRPYCQKWLYDQHLSVIGHIFKANASHPIEEMIKPLLPLVEDVLAYIRSQLKLISELQDVSTLKLYLNAFESIAKVQKLFEIESEEINRAYADVLGDLEAILHSGSESSCVELYSRIRFLYALLELHPRRVKENFLASYLLTEVNMPLKKKETHSEQTKDMQTLWGRMNSEFINTKWKIMAYLMNEELIIPGPGHLKANNSISDDDLIELCVEGLNVGGYEVLRTIMSVLKAVLPVMSDSSQAAELIASVWKLIMERRKTDEFKSFGKSFVEMLFQKSFILKGESSQRILMEYADVIFSIPGLAMVNILMRHIQLMDLAASSESLFCHIIGKALIFGPVQRRDERFTNTVCYHIDKLRICPVWETGFGKDKSENLENCPSQREKHSIYGSSKQTSFPKRNQQPVEYSWPEMPSDYFTSNEVRARAIERILILDKDSERDRDIAKRLIDMLMKVEGEVGGNRERYFRDSHVHRVKHRVMQALLVLEPLLSEIQDRQKLLAWLYEGVLEYAQPSVRYQKEWLLIRMLVKPMWERTLFIQLSNWEEKKSRGLCSLMVVQFHLCQLLPEVRTTYDRISVLVPLLLHQNSEVRLYAQVFICYQYSLAFSRGLNNEVDKWWAISDALTNVSRVMQKQGLNNYKKISRDFFIHSFNPMEHYSLQTIYSELPMLARVGLDELISTKLLRYCGVEPSKITVPLETDAKSLKHDALHYEVFGYIDAKRKGEMSGKILSNYQKKLVPMRHWMPNWDDSSAFPPFTEKKGELVVVASLIDRVPNLGGLARTCEIFGVSEYVISSLRYTEDKQFTSLSVTAEKWIALKEVKANNLMVYILEMKQNGYTVVGAEQTLHSQPLNHVKFPKKTLLLFGNEREGIPPTLLPLLDICVEIPQMGIIRSLNVHVTGALFIWEYVKQHNFPDE